MTFEAETHRTTEPRDESVVEFYWRPGCPFCAMLRRDLRRKRLPVREVNIWSDPSAAARVRSVAGGNETVPTVFVGETAMVNPTVGQVLAAVARERPEAAAAADAERRARRFRWPWSRR